MRANDSDAVLRVRGRGTRMMRRLWVCLLVIGVCLAGFSSCRDGQESADLPFRVTFLSVGEGDCTWIRTSAGDILIDAGPEAEQESVCRRLWNKGLRRVDLLILTHLDEDHIGGADAILETFPTGEVWINGASDSGESVDRLWSAIRAANCPVRTVRAGDWKESGEALLTVLYPFAEEKVAGGNAGSIVLWVQCGEVSLLMTGDAEERAEAAMLERYSPAILDATVLHVGHHGAATSTTKEFLEAVRPEIAVISCGGANQFGHPDGRTLSRLSDAGCTVLRTDLEGDIELTSDGKELFCPLLQKRGD